MKLDRIIGAMAIVGTVALAAFAVLSDRDPSAEPEVVSVAPASFNSTQPSAPPTSPAATEVASLPTTSASSSPATTRPTNTQPRGATVDTGAQAAVLDRGLIRVRVVNAGALSGAARTTTDALIAAGFAAATPRDGAPETFTYLIHRSSESSRRAAELIAATLRIDPVAIVVLNGQPVWVNSAGADIDVLVVLGSGQ